MGGLREHVCEPKQRCSPPHVQTKLQTAQHFRPYAAYELAPEPHLATFLWMLLKIKLKKTHSLSRQSLTHGLAAQSAIEECIA